MFTGIIERVGTVVDTREVSGGRRLRVDVGDMAGTCELGASVCVSGVCLTVADVNRDTLGFDVITETLDRSALGALESGDRVNLERSLCPGGRLDGHFVQGHVDGTAIVTRVEASLRQHIVWLHSEASLAPYIVPKGSIAIDGVSLTIASVTRDGFSVALIPTTLERTTFRQYTAGRSVNIETDIIARTVVHHLDSMKQGGGLTMDVLKRAGFA